MRLGRQLVQGGRLVLGGTAARAEQVPGQVEQAAPGTVQAGGYGGPGIEPVFAGNLQRANPADIVLAAEPHQADDLLDDRCRVPSCQQFPMQAVDLSFGPRRQLGRRQVERIGRLVLHEPSGPLAHAQEVLFLAVQEFGRHQQPAADAARLDFVQIGGDAAVAVLFQAQRDPQPGKRAVVDQAIVFIPALLDPIGRQVGPLEVQRSELGLAAEDPAAIRRGEIDDRVGWKT